MSKKPIVITRIYPPAEEQPKKRYIGKHAKPEPGFKEKLLKAIKRSDK